ncbi:S8 family peptidase [Prosthecobacter sp.]|uniref:S8 family peptidase n=1 Tax=Prosthecobacter sp. TaxID=1965333 RepID=UPI003783E2FA
MRTQPKLISRIVSPLQSIIKRLLPDFAERLANDSEARTDLVEVINTTLLTEYPAARVLPSSLRQRLIEAVLNAILGKAGAAATNKRRGRGAAAASRAAQHGLVAAAAATSTVSMKDLKLSEREVAMLEASAPGNSVRGFLMDAETASDAELRKAVKAILGADWKVARLDPDLNTYRATHADAIFSVPEAWTRSHQLEEHKAIARAEPEIEWAPPPATIGGTPPDVVSIARRSAGGETHLDCSKGETWHLDLINAPAAWDLSKKNKRAEKGEGVLIGHLDTGITHHVEVPLDEPRILVSKGRNLYDPDHPQVGAKPLDPMIDGFGNNPGHGTGTMSILVGRKSLTGSATKAKVIPYRISPTVVHFDAVRIAEGIRQAHADGCDVITMSMGGPPSRTHFLDQIVERASEDGVIICTAAGNYIGSNDWAYLVVWPAALDRVTAVAGCNCREVTWTGSSRGPEVNIAAAAQDVWRAEATKGALSAGGVEGTTVGRGNGTSFATPTVAGTAACWLAHHGGRKAMAEHYGHPRYVPMAFAQLLRTTAFRRPANWDTTLMGPGILDAEALLAAPLPSKAALTGWPRKDHAVFGNIVGGILKIFGSRAPAPRRAAVARAGARRGARAAAPAAASAPAAEAQRFDGELAYHLFDRPALIEMLGQVTAEPPPSTAVAPLADAPRPSRRRSARAAAMAAPAPKAAVSQELEDATAMLRSAVSSQLADLLDRA